MEREETIFIPLYCFGLFTNIDKLFLQNNWSKKGFKLYFQPGFLSEIIHYSKSRTHCKKDNEAVQQW